jgi:heme exporter protein D
MQKKQRLREVLDKQLKEQRLQKEKESEEKRTYE